MIARKAALLALLALATLAALAPAAGAASPVWRATISSQPTNFVPDYALNEGGLPEYAITLTNVGAAPSSGPFSATVTLPAGITEHGSGDQVVVLDIADFTSRDHINPGDSAFAFVHVDVAALAEGSSATATVLVSGGGAADTQAETETTISSSAAPFDFLTGAGGLAGATTDADGLAVTQAGGHPYQLTLDFGFPSKQVGTVPGGGELLGIDGGLRDLLTYLPKGMVVDPSATALKCTEAQFEAPAGCPDASVAGLIYVNSVLLGDAGVTPVGSPLYNMIPAAEEAAQFAFEPLGAGVYIHVSGGVRAGDYAIAAASNDLPSLAIAQVYGARAQLWGDPSAPAHDLTRGHCFTTDTIDTDACPVAPRDTPLLSMPTACQGEMALEAAADSWLAPGTYKTRTTTLTDNDGNSIPVSGCAALGAGFMPTLKARPTTNVADSPSGLSVDLEVPQSQSLSVPATAHLRKAVVTLPEGMAINPASANGLSGCSSAQVGIDPDSGVPDGERVACPDASKIGSVSVDTSLVPDPLVGAVYVATPYDNPFDSLLAIYVTVEDPQTGVLVKLAGRVEANPSTGQLTSTFDENPQLPFSHFKLEFKSGAHGILRTPATCGDYSTTSQLTPWSAPDSGPPADPRDDYSISQSPSGGDCAGSPQALPNSPSFDAGSAGLIAGAHSPFVLHLRRSDGSQNFSALSVSPPPGLVAKLAGTEACPDAALAAAERKSGAGEKANPSCPPSSQVGTFQAAAGAGPAPYYAAGKVYLSAPYKGAPLSFAFITPAVAGPYDLGTIVTKAAVYVDSKTAKVTTVSDPLPTILQGIPLDVRSVDVSLDRPDFTLNATSCDPSSVEGLLTSTLGQIAQLSSRYQLAECGRLGFKPRLSLKLRGKTKRGGHPQLTAIMRPRAGDANIASVSVAFPKSEFLENAHIRTVCTRPDFAADACPAGAVYGSATVTTPLFDYPFAGNVYLRSSDNLLPDLVPDLRGPAYQPIRIESAGRTDSVKGGIRNTFDFVPDAPFTQLVLRMQGGNKGLLVNSRDICARTYRATVKYTAHNGLTYTDHPKVKAQCKKKRKGKKHKGKRGGHRRGR